VPRGLILFILYYDFCRIINIKCIIHHMNPVISTEKKSKSPIAKLFKGKSRGFTLTPEVNGMENYRLLMHFPSCGKINKYMT